MFRDPTGMDPESDMYKKWQEQLEEDNKKFKEWLKSQTSNESSNNNEASNSNSSSENQSNQSQTSSSSSPRPAGLYIVFNRKGIPSLKYCAEGEAPDDAIRIPGSSILYLSREMRMNREAYNNMISNYGNEEFLKMAFTNITQAGSFGTNSDNFGISETVIGLLLSNVKTRGLGVVSAYLSLTNDGLSKVAGSIQSDYVKILETYSKEKNQNGVYEKRIYNENTYERKFYSTSSDKFLGTVNMPSNFDGSKY